MTKPNDQTTTITNWQISVWQDLYYWDRKDILKDQGVACPAANVRGTGKFDQYTGAMSWCFFDGNMSKNHRSEEYPPVCWRLAGKSPAIYTWRYMEVYSYKHRSKCGNFYCHVWLPEGNGTMGTTSSWGVEQTPDQSWVSLSNSTYSKAALACHWAIGGIRMMLALQKQCPQIAMLRC